MTKQTQLYAVCPRYPSTIARLTQLRCESARQLLHPDIFSLGAQLQKAKFIRWNAKYRDRISAKYWTNKSSPACGSKGAKTMRKFLVLLAVAFTCAEVSLAQNAAKLRLIQTIPVPGVQRKWDHFGFDLEKKRFFVTSEEEPAVEVYDLQTNKHISTLTDFKEPHNVLIFPELKQIYVVDGAASEIKILDFDSLKLTSRIPLSIDADPVAYDPATKYLYVVNGGRAAKTPYCLVSGVDTTRGKKLTEIKLY